MFIRRAHTAAIVGALALSGLLTACSGLGADAGQAAQAAEQSTAEACTAIQTATKTAQKKMTDAAKKVATDPTAAITAFTSMTDTISKASAQVSNETIKPKAQAVADSLQAYEDFMKKLQADPGATDTTQMTELVQDMSDAMTDLEKSCGQ